ncbi:MAG: DUF4387 domain-containing protein [Gemmatimonadetes bacterium]|nr:DUF4387 domain-containing protein [Gemmatimonadota bacterium]
MAKLADLAAVLRSKNAGPFLITLDLLFDRPEHYRRVVTSGVLSPDSLAPLYRVPAQAIQVIPFDVALAIKVTIPRPHSAGSPEDTDVYGAQQHAPLLQLEIPE